MKNSLRKRLKIIIPEHGIIYLHIGFNKTPNQIDFMRCVFPLSDEYYRLHNITDIVLHYPTTLIDDYVVHLYNENKMEKTMEISKEIYEFLTLPLIEDIRKLNPKTFKIKHYNDMSYVYVHGYRPIKFSFLL